MSASPPIPLEDAHARLLALAPRLPIEHVDVEGALGRYLAEPIRARRTQPSAHLSAMDGYAVTAGDLAGPWQIVGESAAGHPYFGTMQVGQAVRISTGATLPDDCTAVVVQEDVERHGDMLTLTGSGPAPEDKHIRPKGMDFVEGGLIMPAGISIGPAQAALAISAGHRHLPVRRMPRVCILDSGDELAADADRCEPHQIPASNGAMLLALVRSLAVDAWRVGPVADNLDALIGVFDSAADADVIVTSGGASVGDHDLMRPALEAWGADLNFWRVAIKPGKPILVATKENEGRTRIVLGLPGNPVSSFVTAYLFLLPLLRALLGATSPLPMTLPARLAASVRANGPRREFLRGWWDGQTVVPNPLQDSGALSSLAASNVLIDRQAFAPAAAEGDEVAILLLQNGGIW